MLSRNPISPKENMLFLKNFKLIAAFHIAQSLCLCTHGATQNIGSFFHITDFHMDSNYSEFGDIQHWCHAFSNGKKGPDIGHFGNYSCDAPLALVTATAQGMKAVLPSPDFIVWTGDSLPHVDKSILSTQAVIKTVTTITETLSAVFPNTTTYPSLGNHDYWPASQFPPDTNPVYKAMVKLWAPWLENQARYNPRTLSDYGYYETQLSKNVTLLSLNTNLYYKSNKVKNLGHDPGNQFAWLKNQLATARREKRKIFLTGHIPPGAFERTPNITWFKPEYNLEYLSIIAEYHDVILIQLFGHDHTDSFRLIRNSQGEVVSWILIAPAVTPWRLPLPGSGANNPGFRIIDYDRSTWEIIDVRQYYTDLAEANANGKATWKLEYSFSSAYAMNKGSFVNYVRF